MSTVYQINYWLFEKEEMKEFHVFACCFDEAKNEAESYIMDVVDEDEEWDLFSIEMLPEISIVNPSYLEDEEEDETED